jgi:glycosyltransferase involved in cell wall biosynthesis
MKRSTRAPEGSAILFVIDGLGTGGAERSLAELLPSLKRVGVRTTIACLRRRDEGVESEILASGADVRFLPRGPIAAVRGLRRIVAEMSPDVIHTTILASNLVGRLASIGSSAKVLTSLVNTPYTPVRQQDPQVRPLALSVVRLADILTARALTDHFHAITDAVKSWAVSDMGIRPDRITVVHRGRDPDRLGEASPDRRRSVRRALGLSEEDEVVVTVGRQEFQKGQRHLIEAVAALAASRPRLKLLLAGRRGASSSELDRMREAPELAGRVLFLGHRSDVPDLLAASDVFAFPSLYEGLGGSVLEAMALGLPIVATDLPAVREVVEEGENALLVPVGSPTALADAIELLLDDRDAAVAFGRRSREIFLDRFTSERSADAMVGLYRRLFTGPVREATGGR